MNNIFIADCVRKSTKISKAAISLDKLDFIDLTRCKVYSAGIITTLTASSMAELAVKLNIDMSGVEETRQTLDIDEVR